LNSRRQLIRNRERTHLLGAEAEAWAVMPQGAARLRGVLGALAARAGAREAAAT